MKKNKKLGTGMKSRSKAAEGKQASAVVGHETAALEPVDAHVEVSEAGENRGTLEPEVVQNLELETVADAERKRLVLLLHDKGDMSNEGLLEALMKKSAEQMAVSDPQALEKLQAAHPLIRVDMTKMDPAAMDDFIGARHNGKIELRPRITGLGEQPDGTFVSTVTIQEGYIDPIRQQAESDGVTVDAWLSTRLSEYLESWWQPAAGR